PQPRPASFAATVAANRGPPSVSSGDVKKLPSAGPSRPMPVSQPQSQPSQPSQPQQLQPPQPQTGPNSIGKAGAVTEKKAWSQVVAAWAKKPDSDEAVSSLGAEAGLLGVVPFQLVRCAPEFIPTSMQHYMGDGEAQLSQLEQMGGLDAQQTSGGMEDGMIHTTEVMTTIMVSGVPAESSAVGFMSQLDSWGLNGSYDFFHLLVDEQDKCAGFAFINFVDPSFVLLFCWIYQECQFQGSVTPFEVQGREQNRLYWTQSTPGGGNEPTVLPNAMPSQWAVNAVNMMLAPQFKDQFRKTKLCVFNKKNRCELGPACPFAHSKEEMQPIPDLAKTKLCYNFFRRRCNDSRCKFAHGSAELRSVWVPYSPGIWLMDDMMEMDCLQELGSEISMFGHLMMQ
ncbi:unnamed protein product, partial [Polarella glacialis]